MEREARDLAARLFQLRGAGRALRALRHARGSTIFGVALLSGVLWLLCSIVGLSSVAGAAAQGFRVGLLLYVVVFGATFVAALVRRPMIP